MNNDFFYTGTDRLINLNHVYKFFIERDSRTQKFRIFCEMQDRNSGAFLWEYETFNEAKTQLFKIYQEIKNVANHS